MRWRVSGTDPAIWQGGHRDGGPRLRATHPWLSDVECLTNDNIFDLRELPARLLVVGGGPDWM